METEKLKTSEEWQKLCKIEIVGPDGWDRKNYQFSWYEEPISREEFDKRLCFSTVKFPPDFLDRNFIMWRDLEG